MFSALRDWLEVRSMIREAERRRAHQDSRDGDIVRERLDIAHEALQARNRDYATQLLDSVLAEYPERAAEQPATIRVLLQLERIDEAEQVIIQGMRRFPDNREYAFFHCCIADRKLDGHERLRRWRAYRRRFPANVLAFIFEARTLDDLGRNDAADALLAEGVVVVPDRLDIAQEYAALATAREDWDEAFRRWAVVRDIHKSPLGSIKIAQGLTQLGRHDEADAELLNSRQLFPIDPTLMETRAQLAEKRGDIDAALARWEEVRREFPHVTLAYLNPIRIHRHRGELDQAEGVLAEAGGRAAHEANLQVEAACIAESRRNWAEAAQLWSRVGKMGGDQHQACHRAAAAYRHAGLLAAAEATLDAGAERFPHSKELERQRADLAEAKGDWAAAAACWRQLTVLDPEAATAHAALARSLTRAGAAAEAAAVLREALDRWPDNGDLLRESRAMAEQRAD